MKFIFFNLIFILTTTSLTFGCKHSDSSSANNSYSAVPPSDSTEQSRTITAVDCTAKASCAPDLETGQLITEVRLVEEDSQSNCVEGITYNLVDDLSSLELSNNCSGYFEFTVTSESSLQQILPEIELKEIQENDSFQTFAEELEFSEDGYIENIFENGLFSLSECSNDSDHLRGFSLEIPHNTNVIKLNNLNGFTSANKIDSLIAIVVNEQNQVIAHKTYSDKKDEKSFLISNLLNPAYLVVYSAKDHDSRKCKNINIAILNISFYTL